MLGQRLPGAWGALPSFAVSMLSCSSVICIIRNYPFPPTATLLQCHVDCFPEKSEIRVLEF